MRKTTYSKLSDEDKLLMDELFQYKAGQETKRKRIRNILAKLRKQEMKCTKEIMNLSQRAIGEKFDLCADAAKPLSKKLRRELTKKLRPEKEEKSLLYCECKNPHLNDKQEAA